MLCQKLNNLDSQKQIEKTVLKFISERTRKETKPF